MRRGHREPEGTSLRYRLFRTQELPVSMKMFYR
jgi:hypothetical protein